MITGRPITVAVDTLGCKLNQAETETLVQQFIDAGYRVVPASKPADVYVLNTCTVTHIADRKSRHLLRMARRRSPDALLVATGCYADRAAMELIREGVDLVLDNADKPELLSQVEKRLHLHRSGSPPMPQNGHFRTRSFIKVQEGCSNFCSYCIVPSVRGIEKSIPAAEIIDLVRQRVSQGYQEIVLTGTRVGAYVHAGIDLAGLLKRILDETAITRLRLSSLQPREISPALISLWQDSRLCPHFHLALQSGSDSVLRRMNRKYSVADYEQVISLIRSRVPDAAITTDVIVGFPGETEAEFRESYEFCQRVQFARLHVFPYSPRAGTPAAEMRPVSVPVKKQRTQKMLDLARRAAADFQNTFVGRVMPVLFESHAGGKWWGLTANYIRVSVLGREDLGNRLLPVRLATPNGDGVPGELA